jgi:ornithine cyclodeaminase/alanine dehydrogenase-like protein (mu-crystallin family)
LLLSSACAIVLTMTASPTAVFPHRGLAPHQFTPMSGAHHQMTGKQEIISRLLKANEPVVKDTAQIRLVTSRALFSARW